MAQVTEFGAAMSSASDAEIQTVGLLLVTLDRLVAAFNVGHEDLRLVLPPGLLADVTHIYGCEVVRADIPEPLVAVRPSQ